MSKFPRLTITLLLSINHHTRLFHDVRSGVRSRSAALVGKILQRSRDRVVESLKTSSKNLLLKTTLATNANGLVEAHIHQEEATMKCPECNGSGHLGLTINGGIKLKALSIGCPTCEGEGEIPDELPVNHCPACSIPLPSGDHWCQVHQAAAGLE